MIRMCKNIAFNFLYNVKLKNKMFISHLIIAIIPFLLFISILYGHLTSKILNDTIYNEQALSMQKKEKVEDIIGQIDEALDSISKHPFIKNLNLDGANIDNSKLNKEEFNDFLLQAKTYIDQDTPIKNIRVYIDEPFSSLLQQDSIKYNVLRPLKNIKPSYWHGIFSSKNINYLVCPSLYLTPAERVNLGDYAIIYKLPYTNSNEPAIYLAAYFSEASVQSVLEENIKFANSVTYLIDNRDTLVSSTNPIMVGRYLLKYKDVVEYIGKTSTFTSKTWAFERIYLSYNRIQGTPWYMISAISANDILAESRITLFRILFVYALTTILILYMAFFISNTIVKRISSVINQMNLFSITVPKKLDIYQGDDEIGDLINTYNYMIERINNLLVDIENSAKELRKSEFKALQAQINPHFLYNTLDMISWLSNKGEHKKVNEAIQSMSKFYKLTLNKGNNTVTLREELNHVSLYVKLQNMRFEDKIDFIIDIPDELLDYEVPNIILQPIVENSIQHGILAKESKEGCIIIMGWMEDNRITLIVSDDGIGMSPKKISNILSCKGASSTGSNVAIYNINKRLQLFYNQTKGLVYRSTEGVGTEVEINIPANLKNKG